MDSLVDAMHNVELVPMDFFLEALLIYYDLYHLKDAFEELRIYSRLTLQIAHVLPLCEDVVDWRKIHRIKWLLWVQPDFVTNREVDESTVHEWWPIEEDWVVHESGTCRVHVSALQGD